MLDRIGIRVRLEPVSASGLWGKPSVSRESSAVIRERVDVTRARQRERAKQLEIANLNARLSPDELERACRLSAATRKFMTEASVRLGLSARGVHRVLRVSRTVADHCGARIVEQSHVLEALNYRGFD